jgi:hypothetical protein
VIFSSRTLDGIDREPAQFFKRSNPHHPALGGAHKDRFFVARAAVPALRQAWADVANWHLERAGLAARIDPRNLREQGVDRDPESRLAPYHATQAKYRGVHTPEWQATLQSRATRQRDSQQEAARACHYWEARKITLGIAEASGMSHDVFVTRVAQASREVVTAAQTTRAQRPDRATLTQALQTVQQALDAQQTRVDRLYAELLQEQHRARTGTPRSPRAQQRIDALLREPDRAVPAPPRSARREAPLIGHRRSQIYHEPGMPHYGEVHPNDQVWFGSQAEARQAGYRRAQPDQDGRGAEHPMPRESRPTRIAGRLIEKQTIGGREYALLGRADGSQALVPWHPSMTARLGQHATLAHHPGRGGWQVLSLGLDRERLPSGARVRLRDDHEEERTR